MVTLLAWRITSGVYYELVNDTRAFKAAFGDAFQALVGDVLNKTNATANRQVLQEELFRIRRVEHRTTDWIVTDGKTALFVECKGKRLSQRAKEEIDELDTLHADLTELAKAVVQTYKGIGLYQQGHYPQLAYDPSLASFQIVVTLEDWFFMGDITSYVRQDVIERLTNNGIDSSVIGRIPYVVCSMQEFEILCQILQTHTLFEVLSEFTGNQEYAGWGLDGFLRSRYGDDYDNAGNIFSDDFNELFSTHMKNVMPV